ncbi:hypothetical protein HX869_13485 [Pseudomonas sp. P7779]|uniref:hypothetical protein n=1 Tax=Pseudomonas sp. P7779 TaxID=2738832 RepID=UPI0015BD9C0D|nr:hypothetical protein [Pseudomonas sp. P7779]NWC99753.1 hypothetical protein [Pseudomonas sp. P7779]
MENEHNVDFTRNIEGITMTLETWKDLQSYRSMPIFSDINQMALETVQKNKYFKVYDPNSENEIYALCSNVNEVNKLFNLLTADKT